MHIADILTYFNIAFCWKRCNKGIFHIEYEADNEIDAPDHIVPFGMFTFVGVQPSIPSPIAEGQRQEARPWQKRWTKFTGTRSKSRTDGATSSRSNPKRRRSRHRDPGK